MIGSFLSVRVVEKFVTERDFLLIPKKKEKGKLFFLLFSLLDMTEFFVFLFKRVKVEKYRISFHCCRSVYTHTATSTDV
jgi:hypothetical protein